ncbi:heterokaryon incompatibility protein-domain-containing protein [Lasiosphaeris hirsuta]|uniref:Heterokaryon incompatibility protein-domain-containing protein n=1 Tax=Lasiosphaeris hirsuta TaxID=260670 RepID=A0AA39ZXY9_9PEZI|nr:heterokaryon incompatibility protein-domain-containing protein [Lasiosphaeris hirsuta]
MPLCKPCIDSFQGQEMKSTPGSSGFEPRPQHYSMLGYLKSAKEKCYICWRSYRELDDDDCELLHKVGRALELDGERSLAGDSDLQTPNKPVVFSYLEVAVTKFPIGYKVTVWQGFRREFVVAISERRKHGLFMDVDEEDIKDLSDLLHKTKAVIILLSMDEMSSQPRIQHSVPRSPRTDSAETFSLIRSWIQDCIANHQPCIARRTDRTWSPTRLLDIGDPLIGGTVAPATCRLIGGTEASATGNGYITLSHRWGASDIIKLTAEKLGQFRTGIPVASLPTTFGDCIYAARQLHTRYIWIDSLCIIQSGDDGVDWLREASRMHLVYKNAYCNISADWGDESRGLFFERDLGVFDQVQIDLNIISEPDGLATRLPFSSVEDRIWIDEICDSPLNSRAWVLQERLLSARNLHFCRREVFWECCQTSRCETLPLAHLPGELNGSPDTSRLKALQLTPRDRKHQLDMRASGLKGRGQDEDAKDQEMSHLYGVWADIIRIYSRTQLSFTSDKLITISGIAQYMKTVLHDTYVAGMWLRHLRGQLMWEAMMDPTIYSARIDRPISPIDQNRSALADTHCYRAPSFSWASTDLPVGTYPSHPYYDDFAVDGVCIVKFRPPQAANTTHWEDEPAVEDAFGPLSRPQVELKVVGKVMPAQTVPKLDHHTDSWLKPSEWEIYQGYVYPLRYYEQHVSEGLPHQSLAEVRYDRPVDALRKEEFFGKLFYYLPWRDIPAAEGELGMGPYTLVCLLLESIDPTMGRFRRVGQFRVANKSKREFMGASGYHGQGVGSWSYNVREDLHTIYIV